MSRNEIKLRKQLVDEEALQRHRNYDLLLQKHKHEKRKRRTKKIFIYSLVITVVLVLLLIVVSYFMVKLERERELKKEKQTQITLLGVVSGPDKISKKSSILCDFSATRRLLS